MKETRRPGKFVPTDTADRQAARGKRIPRFFMKTETIAGSLHPIEVKFTSAMLDELDAVALELNITRESLIKTLVRQALDQHYLARVARQKPANVISPVV